MSSKEEIIADSEEELSMDGGVDDGLMDWTSEIATFDKAQIEANPSTREPPPFKNASSISQFTLDPSVGDVSTSISAFTTPSVKPPRPRPRPRKKNIPENVPEMPSNIPFLKPLDDVADALAAPQGVDKGDLYDFPLMSSIADRAKTRQRKATGLSVPQWDDEDFDFPQPKPTGKPIDPNPPQTLSKKGKERADLSSHVIELTDDSEHEDELRLKQRKTARKLPQPDVHQISDLNVDPPRPKPRPRPRKKKADSDVNPSVLQSENHHSTPPNPPPDTDMMSSLPDRTHTRNPLFPSSLPPSDIPFPTPRPDIPQIETLPDVHSDPHGTWEPPSSNGFKHRSEIDELFSGDEDLFGPEELGPPPPLDPKSLPPPPTFFAGSSSSQVHEDPSKDHFRPQDEVADLIIIPTMPPKPVDVPAKEKRKKKVDDDDADWDAAPSKPKVKRAPTKKAKTAQTLPEVEVLISTKPPPSKKKAKAKDKAQGKSKKGAEQSKDVYKSKEMIEDSDEDPLFDSYRPEESSTALFSPAGPKERRETVVPPEGSLEPLSPLPDYMVDDDGDDDAAVVVRKASRKKRKSTVVEDDEDFGEMTRMEDSPSKRQKKEKGTNKDKKGKGKAKEVDEANVDTDGPPSRKQRGKPKQTQILSDEENTIPEPVSPANKEPIEDEISSKENIEPPHPDISRSPKHKASDMSTPRPRSEKSLRHSLVSRARATPMSELIKRVNSLPNSPFPASASRVSTISKTATAYSPYLKSSRSLLSKIAPLHPNRRTPPPPLPPPPPKRKTKKELEREERWEEEMIESVGGIESWAAMSDMERRDMRKAKIEMEMGGWD